MTDVQCHHKFLLIFIIHLSSSSSSTLFFSALSFASNLALVKTKCIDCKSRLQKIQLTSDSQASKTGLIISCNFIYTAQTVHTLPITAVSAKAGHTTKFTSIQKPFQGIKHLWKIMSGLSAYQLSFFLSISYNFNCSIKSLKSCDCRGPSQSNAHA